jgi:hypothetical protein
MDIGKAEVKQPSMTWLTFALMTVVAWGLYGILLHTGQLNMADPINGRYKAFLFVGIAYFLTAVIAPLVVLMANGASWKYPVAGMAWSLIAGIAGAIGAFCVLLAFGAKGNPAVVMAIVFAGAPVVNAIVATLVHPPAAGMSAIKFPFVLGLLMAAGGGYLVTKYRPMDAPATKPAAAHPAPASEPASQ